MYGTEVSGAIATVLDTIAFAQAVAIARASLGKD